MGLAVGVTGGRSAVRRASLGRLDGGTTGLVRRSALAAVLVTLAGPASAIDDGPRGYQFAPVDLNSLTFIGLFQEGNQSFSPGTSVTGANIDIRLGLAQYTRTVDIAGNLGAFFVVLPAGEVSGSLQTMAGDLTGRSSGLGDVILGTVVGLYGTPALPAAEWARYDPEFSVGLLGKVYLPTGDFGDDTAINLGAGRWTGQIGLPMTYYIASSMLDPELTTFELTPSVTIFEAANGISQDPVWTLEGHVTRNLGSRFWASLDGLFVFGGETSTNAVSNDDEEVSLGLGATLGVSVTESWALKFSFGEFVYHNTDGLDGRSFRMVSSFAF